MSKRVPHVSNQSSNGLTNHEISELIELYADIGCFLSVETQIVTIFNLYTDTAMSWEQIVCHTLIKC